MEYRFIGNEIQYPEGKVGSYVKYKDEQTFNARVGRLEYLHKLNPEGLSLAGNMELVLSYREIQKGYILGHYLSVILLGQSYIEKNLHIHLEKTD